MVLSSLARRARAISQASLASLPSPEAWSASLAARRQQWLEMLGLFPLPERTPLNAEVTGVLERGDYVVEKLHFQCLPGAYVVGNLYRPAHVQGRLPAVLYLCGHTKGKVNPTYQANPRWFGQHGYVALVLDPIQLGESQGMHHGTYHCGRWDWYSRGYAPAGTEVWNAMRALDYLASRPDVDPERMGVTGLSGGGAMSWFLGAADERVRVVVPVCQTGSIEHLVSDRAVDGHCDCAFWINTYGWCTPDLGALIAPRALLVASGTEDVLWRPYAFRDVLHRIRHLYQALGVPEKVELVEDLSPHGYTPKLRKAIFEWFNRYLKGDTAPVEDDVTDFVEPEENLLVFGGRLPADDRMRVIDTLLGGARARKAEPRSQTVAGGDSGSSRAPAAASPSTDPGVSPLVRLREVSFRQIPDRVEPVVRDVRADGSLGTHALRTYVFDTADGLTLQARAAVSTDGREGSAMVVFALDAAARSPFMAGHSCRPPLPADMAWGAVEVRGTGGTSLGEGLLWTVRRSYPLIGCTLPERQTYDLLCGLAALRREAQVHSIALYGKGWTAVLALYAALFDPEVSEVILEAPPETHEDPKAPEFLNILSVGDLPENLALMHPRPVTFVGAMPPAYERVRQVYIDRETPTRFRVLESMAEWRPAEEGPR